MDSSSNRLSVPINPQNLSNGQPLLYYLQPLKFSLKKVTIKVTTKKGYTNRGKMSPNSKTSKN